ncbi:MAG: ECF transporter S component [Firmicutes bacterium]|nr:ECF transporter S component [Bacillota bacterium]
MKSFKIAYTAMFAALICLATWLLRLPIPGGVGIVHLGDFFIFAAAFFLGLRKAAMASAVGSSLANILMGLPIFAPATFIIKGAMPIIVCLIVRGNFTMPKMVVAFATASAFMVVGYFWYVWLIFGWHYAVADFFFGLIQPAVCITLALIAIPLLKQNPYLMQVRAQVTDNK